MSLTFQKLKSTMSLTFQNVHHNSGRQRVENTRRFLECRDLAFDLLRHLRHALRWLTTLPEFSR
jgi:hypothetical protein